MKLLVDIEQLDHEAISWWKKKTPAMRGVLMQAVYELESSVPAPRRCAGRVVGPHGMIERCGRPAEDGEDLCAPCARRHPRI